MSVKIITDSGSDMMHVNNDRLSVVPLTIRFGQEEFKDDVDLSHHAFYEKLVEEDIIPQTSQATPYEFAQVIEEARKDGDEVIVITLSSKLSGTHQSATLAASEFDDVYVVDSENVTLGEKALVSYALQLAEEGKDARTIVDILNKEKKNIRLIALLDTLEYLKKGGRISGAAAAVGTLMNVKPVIAIENGEVVTLGKARGSKKGNNMLREQVEKSGGIDYSKPYFVGYTGLDSSLADKYVVDSQNLWEDPAKEPEVHSVGGAIGTHAGPGAIALAYFAAAPEEQQ